MSFLEIYDVCIIVGFIAFLAYQIKSGWIPLEEVEKDRKNKS